jgi:hypothetical protein
LVLALDDLVSAPSEAYARITRFLGIENTGIVKFEQANSFRRHRNRIPARIGRYMLVHSWAKWLRLRVKPILNSQGIHPLAMLNAANTRPATKPTLSIEDQIELHAFFDEDVSLLEELLKRDFSHWRLRPDLKTYGFGSI